VTPEQLQEEISKAYLHAVAAKCGYAVGNWTQDHGCVDTTVAAATSLGTGTHVRPKVDVQLKATRQQDVEHDTFVSWQLEADHYEQLRAPAQLPHLLVVLLLPNDIRDSVEHTVDQLVIRRCAYWVKMTGMPAIATASKTVRLPKTQVFSPTQLEKILTAVSERTF
jgi:hypothetical protein